MPKSFSLVLLLVLASVSHSQDSQVLRLSGPNGGTFARDKAGEDVVAKSLTDLLAEQRITGLSRYYPTLLSEGVCSSILKGSWVTMMRTDGPAAFYQSDDISQPSNKLRKMVIDETAALHPEPMKRYAVAVWEEHLANGSSRYWVGIFLAKSPLSDWLGSHLGADTPQEMISPNGQAERDVSRGVSAKVSITYSNLWWRIEPLSGAIRSTGRITAIQHRKRLAPTGPILRKICLRGAFDLEVRRKPQAFAAVAVMQVGIMEIECSFVIRLMLLGPAIVVDADGQR